MSEESAVFVSAVTIWEIAIKYPMRKRKDAMPISSREAMDAFAEAGLALQCIRYC